MARAWVALALVGTWLGTANAQDVLPVPPTSPGTPEGFQPTMAPGAVPGGEKAVPPGAPTAGAAPSNPTPAPQLPPGVPGQVPGVPGYPGPEPACPPDFPCEEQEPSGDEGPACPCKNVPRLYTNVEFLQWWFRRRPTTVPLITTGDPADLIPGALGQPGTRILQSQNFQDETGHAGGRLTVGYWLDCDHCFAVEGNAFGFQERTSTARFGTPGAAPIVLARPFINANTLREDADPVALPNILGGGISFSQPERLFGGELNLRVAGRPSIFSFSTYDLLLGVRYLQLEEKLIEQESLIDLPGLGMPGNQFSMLENFTTKNRFYGGQIGTEINTRFCSVLFVTTLKVAVGYNREDAQVGALSRVIEPDGTVTTAANRGLFVQPSNAGPHKRSRLAAVPEFAFNAIYEFNDYFRLNIGYTFLFQTNVIRPGNQIDRSVNIQALQPLGQIGPARPQFPFRESEFYAQGLNVALEFSY